MLFENPFSDFNPKTGYVTWPFAVFAFRIIVKMKKILVKRTLEEINFSCELVNKLIIISIPEETKSARIKYVDLEYFYSKIANEIYDSSADMLRTGLADLK